jgi:hypothetical protein
MAAEREIRAKELVNDIISGLGDNELIHKYRLTFRGLQSVYRKLVELDIVDAQFLEGRIATPFNAETTVITRLPRKEIYIPLPVRDEANPLVLGLVMNLSERGLGIKGLQAEVDEIKRFVIKPEKFLDVNSVTLKAKCRWVQPSDDPQEIMSGFEIVSIAERELKKLKHLIQTLEYMYR